MDAAFTFPSFLPSPPLPSSSTRNHRLSIQAIGPPKVDSSSTDRPTALTQLREDKMPNQPTNSTAVQGGAHATTPAHNGAALSSGRILFASKVSMSPSVTRERHLPAVPGQFTPIGNLRGRICKQLCIASRRWGGSLITLGAVWNRPTDRPT